jgi:hypothetical protein
LLWKGELSVKNLYKFATVICLSGAPASAAIIVTSTIESAGNGVQAQAVLENSSTVGEVPIGVAIKEFRGTIIIRDDVQPPIDRGGTALQVTKTQLNSQLAWGSGLPLGYDNPPPTDPGGPWQGMLWPFRDAYDYFNPGNLPLADDVGTFFHDSPDVYGFLNVTGIQRGGPTDPAGPPSQGGIAWVRDRGLNGTGVDDLATYFSFDVTPVSGDPNRYIRVRVIGASAVIVQEINGVFSEVTVPVPDSEDFFIQLPEPSSAMIVLSGLGFAVARRRRD